MTVGAVSGDDGADRSGRPVVLAALAFVASLVAVAVVAGRRWDTTIIHWLFVVLLGSAWWLDRSLHAVVGPGRRPQWRRVGLAIVAFVVAAGLTVVGYRDTVLHPFDKPLHLGGLFFVGPGIGVVAAASLLSELRMYARSHVWPLAATFGGATAAAGIALGRPRADGVWVLVVLVAVVLGEVGTELLSERVSVRTALTDGGDEPGPSLGWVVSARHARAGALVGLVLVALTGAALLSWSVSPSRAIALLLMLGLVSWMASSDNDALFVVVPVIAIALLWASAPREPLVEEQQRVDEHQARSGEPYFLVLGDSYTSGEGAQAYLKGTNSTQAEPTRGDNQCRQAPTAWPWLLAEAHPGDVPDRLLFEACSGAVAENIASTRDVTFDDRSSGRVGGTAEIDLAERDIRDRGLQPPTFIVLGVGGNDAGFSRLGTACLGPGDCSELASAFVRSPEPDTGQLDADDLAASALEDISDDLHRAYQEVTDKFPKTPVVVTAYPRPVAVGNPCPAVLFDGDERLFINEFVSALNTLIEAEAGEFGFSYLGDLQGSLERQHLQLCDPDGGGQSGLNFIGLNPKVGTTKDYLDPQTWNHNSFHPNERGHRAMADAAAAWFADRPQAGLPEPVAGMVPHTMRPVARLPQEEAADQCGFELPRCGLGGDGWLSREVSDGYRRLVGPLAIVLVGWWLMLVWLRPWLPRWVRDRWHQLPS